MHHWALELADYRRTVAEAYADARAAGSSAEAWRAWRDRRDALIGPHPQSPLPEAGRTPDWTTPFFDHDPAWRVSGTPTPAAEPVTYDIPHSADGFTTFAEVGQVAFAVDGQPLTLTMFWLDAYGGGLFLPFRDDTGGDQTYGGGRYLLDTVKGADLGVNGQGRLILDFNYAYHPSCAWNDQWSCPLAPPANRLPVSVTAGEQLPLG
ncbi:hypothetical protein BH24ACT15_BH24ACT15_00340 [soil metagenome]